MTPIWRASWSAGGAPRSRAHAPTTILRRRNPFTELAATSALSFLPTVRTSTGVRLVPVPAARRRSAGLEPVEGRTCLLRRQPKPRRCPLASTVEIAPRTEADLPLLFGLAKSAYIDVPGWSD